MTPALWLYRPDYHIALSQSLSGPRATQTRTWRLHSLRDLSASLTTTGVGAMQLALWDIDNVLSDHVQPAAMDVVEVQTTNRHGQWGQVWTGYIDTVTPIRYWHDNFGVALALALDMSNVHV